MNTEMYSQQNYSFWRFAPYAALVFHLLFITHRPVQMKYPQKQLEVQETNPLLLTRFLSTPRCKINSVRIQQRSKPY